MNSVNESNEKLTSFVTENINDMMMERMTMTKRFDKEYTNIKTVCSTYFEKYDNSLQEIDFK